MLEDNPLALSDSIAIVIIAGLLSLLPVVILLWVYYVREHRPSVPGRAITRFFVLGMFSVGCAVVLERGVYMAWQFLSPKTSGIFFSENLNFGDPLSLVIAALVSLGIVATIEETVRYLFMRRSFTRLVDVDQIIDGVQLGFALGLGFAFIENTFYFLHLFKQLDFDTLVVVFFLRFLISTVGHMVFGGVMGYYLVMAQLHPTERHPFLRQAFLFPWLMHGLFDMLLTVQLSFYTVLLLGLPLYLFWTWFQDDRMFELHVLRGQRLRFPVASRHPVIASPRPHIVEVIPNMRSCPNCYVPIEDEQARCLSCGLRFYRRRIAPILPFLSGREEGTVGGAWNEVP